jgi:hypothetical protein
MRRIASQCYLQEAVDHYRSNVGNPDVHAGIALTRLVWSCSVFRGTIETRTCRQQSLVVELHNQGNLTDDIYRGRLEV